MFRIVEQTQAQMQQGYFSNNNIYVDPLGKLTLVNRNMQTNLAFGKPYTKSLNATLSSPDTGNSMFTDGIIGGQWFRYNATSEEDITIDLGQDIVVGGTQFFTGTTASMSQHYIDIYVSRDNVNFDLVSRSGNGLNGQQEFKNTFDSVTARYVRFKMLRTTAGVMSVSEGEVYPGLTHTAYREQVYDISSVGILRTNNAYWIEEVPEGTSVLVETSISLDSGNTWTSWSPLFNGGTIQNVPLGTDLSNGRLKVRTTLTTNTINVPKLQNFNFYFDDAARVDENYIIIPRNAFSLKRINPDMTSATTPSPYSVSGTGVNESGYPAWKLFDGITNSTTNSIGVWRHNYLNSSSVTYAEIDVGQDNWKSISAYRLYKYATQYITAFRIDASSDRIDWVTLDQRSELSWNSSEDYKEFKIDLSKHLSKFDYRYFRFYVMNSVTQQGYINELQLFELIDGYGYQISSRFIVPSGYNLTSKLFIPINNRATGSIRILPLIKYELPSLVNIKIHSNLSSRVNVPISNRASGIVNIVKQPTTTISLPPEKDAFVRESIPKLNYGSEQDMYAGFNTNYNEIYRSFLGFDTSSIPNNAEIKSAYFKFYNELNSTPIQKVELYELSADWTEKGITWDNQPKPTDKIGEIEVGSAGGYLYADFTDIVREWYEGTKTNRGFIMKVSDETEIYYKRFYTRESKHSPSLEIEYYDKTVYTFEKIDILGRALIRQQSDKDLTSRLNVKQIWFDHGIPSRLKVANMGTVDSHLIVKDPNLPSRITVKQRDNEDLISRITVRVKLEQTFTSEVTVNKPFQFGRIRVRRRDTRELLSKVRVRVGGQKDFPSSVNISKGFVHSRVSVVRSEYLTSRVVVAGLGNRTLRGQLIIRRSDLKDIVSHLRIFQKELLASRVHIVSGYLKSRVHIPFRANMDQPSRVRIKVRSAKDMISRVRIEDPYGDSWAYVYIL